MNLVETRSKKESPLAQARKSSLMTQRDMADKLDLTVQTISRYEREPELISIKLLKQWYYLMGISGRVILREYINSLFCPVLEA